MKMKQNKITSIFLILIIAFSFFTIYVNFSSHRSSIVQTIMTEDLNNKDYTQDAFSYFNSLNSDLPNLSFTAIPIKGLMSRYYRFKGDYTKALELLDQSMMDNPYIKFNESEKAEIYSILKVRDSFVYYAKAAFDGLPKNQRHWTQYNKALMADYDTLGLDNAFEKVKNSSNSFFRLVYLTSNITINRRSEKVKDIARESIDLFPDAEEVKLVADYLIYGKENVELAIKLAKEAESFFQTGVYDLSSKNYLEAANLNPGDISHKENAAFSLFREKKYQQSETLFLEVIESGLTDNGKAEYLLASLYEETNKMDLACDFINKSRVKNFPLAFEVSARVCSKLE